MAKSTKQDNKQSYTHEIADEICRRVSAGESLTNVCEDDHMPDTDTVMQWFMGDVDGFQGRYIEVATEVVNAHLAPVVSKFTTDLEYQVPELPSLLPTRALIAQVLENMGTENPEVIIDQLAAAGCLAD